MTYHIFIDESQRGDWFVMAGILLQDIGLVESDKKFLRQLHACDDRLVSNQLYKDNFERVIKILTPRQPKVIYSVRNLHQPVQLTATIPFRLAGIKAVLTPFMPFFGVASWQIVIEQFMGFAETRDHRGEKEEYRVRKARTQSIEQYLQGEVTHLLESLYGLNRKPDLKLYFADWKHEPWLGAVDYIAYSMSNHSCKNGGVTSRLEEQFKTISFFRVDA